MTKPRMWVHYGSLKLEGGGGDGDGEGEDWFL